MFPLNEITEFNNKTLNIDHALRSQFVTDYTTNKNKSVLYSVCSYYYSAPRVRLLLLHTVAVHHVLLTHTNTPTAQ